jgi:hypothetical protein
MTDESFFTAEELAAFREVDRLRALEPVAPTKRSVPAREIADTRLTRTTPQASTTMMSPQDSAAWNSWAEALIATRLNAFADTLGGECGLIEGRLQKQITCLQQEIVELKIAAAYERGKNAGVIIDLPALPRARRDVA